MLRHLWLAALLALSTAATLAAQPVVVHVATTGNDEADGSAERPVATLQAAQRLVRGILAKSKTDVRVDIAPGTYYLQQPLILTPDDAPKSAENTVTFAGRGDVRLSGGLRIPGWKAASGAWTAPWPPTGGGEVAPFRQLWVNGDRAIRARSPNEGYYRVEQAGEDQRTSFVTAAPDLLAIAEPETAEVMFFHDWSTSRIRLRSIDAAARTYHFTDRIGADMAQFAITNFEPHPRYWIENAAELLDAPGEWFLDEAKGEVRYIPRDGQSPAAADVVAGRLPQLVVLRGDGERRVQGVRFEGITFCHSRFDLPPHGYAESQAGFHEARKSADDRAWIAVTAAVHLEGAANCRFTNCRFERLGGVGLHVARGENVTVDRCLVSDVGGSGLMVGHGGGSDQRNCHDVTISDCTIERCGVEFHGAVGVWVGIASETTVRRNEVRLLPYTGVSVGWQWNDAPTSVRGNVIQQNHIHHIMQSLSDGAGIYTLGRQPETKLLDNLIHDVPVNAGRAESNGIFMDEGSTDIEVRGNTIYNIARSPIRFHRAGANTIVGNRLVKATGIPTFMFNACEPGPMRFDDNEEITADAWQPPPGDPADAAAGPAGE